MSSSVDDHGGRALHNNRRRRASRPAWPTVFCRPPSRAAPTSRQRRANAGAGLNLVTITIAFAGVSVAHFWWALVLLGVGWNFLYTGGTTLLTETYRPEERAKAQGANDQAIFLMMLVSSFTSGATVTTAGWERVNLLALPLVAIVAVALVWFALHQRARRTAAA